MKFNLFDMAEEVIHRTTMFEKATGLMFKKPSYLNNKALLFVFEHEKKIPLHMMFVFFSIDMVWVNSDFEVIDMKKSAKPFTPNIFHRGKAQYVIELPAGTLTKHGVKLMDKIVF